MDLIAGLTRTQCAALVSAQQDGTTLYRGRLDLEYGYVTAATLRALADRGLVELKVIPIEHYSRSGLFYKGTWPELDHGKLTEAGRAARRELMGE
jgi:hypothetical protein